MEKVIRMLDGTVKTVTVKVKPTVTTVGFVGKFDQLVADSMGIKDSIYDENGALRNGPDGWELKTFVLFGATLKLSAVQQDLFAADKGEIEIEAIRLSDVSIIRLQEGQGMRISFHLAIAQIPYQLLQYVEILQNGLVNISITPASKTGEQSARVQAIDFGLFKEKKLGEKPNEEGAGEEGSDAAPGDDNDPDSGQEEPPLTGEAKAQWDKLQNKGLAKKEEIQ